MSAIFVILVLKTVIYFIKFLDFQNYESLDSEHSESNTNFYGQILNKNRKQDVLIKSQTDKILALILVLNPLKTLL